MGEEVGEIHDEEDLFEKFDPAAFQGWLYSVSGGCHEVYTRKQADGLR